jgi:hypothetical protein
MTVPLYNVISSAVIDLYLQDMNIKTNKICKTIKNTFLCLFKVTISLILLI